MKASGRTKLISLLWIPPKDEDPERKEVSEADDEVNSGNLDTVPVLDSSALSQTQNSSKTEPENNQDSKIVPTSNNKTKDDLKRTQKTTTKTIKSTTKKPEAQEPADTSAKISNPHQDQEGGHIGIVTGEENNHINKVKEDFEFHKLFWPPEDSTEIERLLNHPKPDLYPVRRGIPLNKPNPHPYPLEEYGLRLPDQYDEETQEDPSVQTQPQFPFCPFQFQASIEQKVNEDDKDLDDIALMTEFFELYGTMDTDQESFKKLFFRFKQQRMEEIEDKKLFPGMSRTGQVSKEKFLPPMHSDLFGCETSKDQWKPLKEKAREWFTLPRCEIPVEIIDILDNEEIEEIQTPIMKIHSSEEEKRVENPSLNLTLFDPRFKMEKIILDIDKSAKVGAYDNWHETIKIPLRQKYAKLLNKYPMGISLESFRNAFKEEYGYFPKYAQANYFSFGDLANNHPDVFYVVPSPLKETLFFPAYFQSLICSPTELFFKIWTKVQVILSFHNYILPLEKIPSELKEMFGMDVNPKNWCFKESMEFYNLCLKRWPQEEWISIERDIKDKEKFVLVQKNDKFPETLVYYKRFILKKIKLEAMKEEEEELAKIMKSIPKQYARLNEQLKDQGAEIPPGIHLRCLGGWILNPGNFYLQLGQFWNKLENLMDRMQAHYRKLRSPENEKATPESHQLIVGLIVAVKRKEDGEWHRARIVEKIDDETIQAFFIDYGDPVRAKRTDVRFLLREFLGLMNAQAVRCCAKMGPGFQRMFPLSLKGHGWTDEEGDLFRKITHDKHLAVSFKESVIVNGILIWKVYVHVLRKNDVFASTILIHHVEREVLRLSRGMEIKGTDESEYNLKSIELATIGKSPRKQNKK